MQDYRLAAAAGAIFWQHSVNAGRHEPVRTSAAAVPPASNDNDSQLPGHRRRTAAVLHSPDVAHRKAGGLNKCNLLMPTAISDFPFYG